MTVSLLLSMSVCHMFAGRLKGDPFLPNSSETAWNFQTPFYRMETGSLRMVYVNFHEPICPRDFSMTIYYFRACRTVAAKK